MKRRPRVRAAVFGLFVVAVVWLVSTGVRTQGAAAPILVVVNGAAANPFGAYLPEILRAEGIKAFTTVQLASVDASTLAAARVVILADTPLLPAQATLFTNYVTGGGRLIAMRPDAQLHGVLGVAAVGTSTTNGYLAINQSDPTGTGLTNLTLPVQGVTAHYTMAGGASSLATLYSDRTTATIYPAVVRYNNTVTWAFDLARAVAYARQGPPANANVNYSLPALQSFDMFFTGFDAQRMRVPYADVEMRLFSRAVRDLLASDLPLPQLWYFPSARRALMIVAGDSHLTTLTPHEQMLSAAESFGARVTLFLSRYLGVPSAATAANWRARGHELALHPYGYEDGVSLSQGFQNAVNYFNQQGWGPAGPTVRSHQLEWLGWTDAVDIAAGYGTRLDLNHYSFGPSAQQPDGTQGMGYITGSGLPMRFIRSNGSLSPVYGLATTFIDHQLFGITVWADTLTAAQALARTQGVMAEALSDYHTVMVTQFHVDYYGWGDVNQWANGTMQYGQTNNIPMWTGQRWLAYTEARDATTLTNITWAPTTRQLQFTATVPAGAEAQTLMVPAVYRGEQLLQVQVNGAATVPTTQTINGRSMAMFPVAAGASIVLVTYQPSTISLGVNDVSILEGTGGTNNAVFTVTLSPASNDTVTVNYATSNGTAIAPADYAVASGTLTFPAGQTSRTVTVPLVTDAVDEPHETFNLLLSAPTNAVIVDGTGIATILNDDAVVPVMTINDVNVTEGNSGTTPVTLTVSLSAITSSTVTVNWTTTAGTATAGADYVTASGVLTFPPGSTSQQLTVSVVGDTQVEATETFTVTLAGASGATIGDGSGLVSIFNDDIVLPSIGINDMSVTEGNAGTSTATFAVALSPASASAVTVAWTTANGTATAGSDYNTASGIVTFPAGSTSQPVTVSILGDTTYEPDETFSVNLSSPTNAVIADATGVATIANDDAAPPATGLLAAYAFDEGTGTTSADRSGNGAALTLSATTWTTAGRYGNGVTLNGTSSRLTGPAAFTLPAAFTYEAWMLSPTVAPYETLLTVGPDRDLYLDGHVLRFYLGGVDRAFGTAISAGVWHHVALTSDGTTLRAYLDGAALGTPQAATTTAITAALQIGVWGSGASSTDFYGGSIDEVRIYGRTLSLAEIQADMATPISDVPVVPAIGIGNISVNEGNAGTSTATFTATLSVPTTATVTVNWATANGTATAGSDYVAASGTLTFPPGNTSQPIPVTINGDTVAEASETFAINLSAPTNATIAVASAAGTIVNDDAVLPTIAINDVAVTEGNSGSTAANFIVTLSPASASTVTVAWTTANGTATAGSDYTAASGTVTFPAGNISQAIVIQVLGDTTNEANETFAVNLSSPANATIADASGQGTITNDDAAPPSAGLLAAYAFDEGTGTSTQDRSGNGVNLTLNNTAWTTSGRYGNGVTLNGTNSRLIGPSFTLPATFTYEAWVLSPTAAAYESIVTVGSNRDLYLEGHVVRFYTGGVDRAFGSAISAGTWHHIAVTSDGATLRAYLNGEVLGTAQAGATTAITATLQLGAWIEGATNTDYFGGSLDEVRIYNRVLSQSEIQTDLATPIGAP